MPIAPSWQAAAQSPQPSHFSSSIRIIYGVISVALLKDSVVVPEEMLTELNP
jgi:hypothetical protein